MQLVSRACEKCSSAFSTTSTEMARGGGRFCSRLCANSARTGRPPVPVEKRFDSGRWTVDMQTGCYLWTGKKNKNGYGRIKVNGKEQAAHRVSYAIANGAIPDGMCVLHRCDTPACVNPEHLFAGTVIDNLRDMHAKGRARGNTSNHRRDRLGRFA